ncbi:uncharacterized protein LOC105382734 isoform X4 [Plutella xylostella]|uniref:uncharacterized protein LOC105382734 isoform X4 n=1 Tax=Plutella xylostella TaxID=51655 RepID=UPI0020327C13|nr:uncharacterized protein LOC105382734 isoform X4 [Plutella xylostella]
MDESKHSLGESTTGDKINEHNDSKQFDKVMEERIENVPQEHRKKRLQGSKLPVFYSSNSSVDHSGHTLGANKKKRKSIEDAHLGKKTKPTRIPRPKKCITRKSSIHSLQKHVEEAEKNVVRVHRLCLCSEPTSSRPIPNITSTYRRTIASEQINDWLRENVSNPNMVPRGATNSAHSYIDDTNLGSTGAPEYYLDVKTINSKLLHKCAKKQKTNTTRENEVEPIRQDQDLETKTAENTKNINEKKASIETVPSEVEQNTTDFERDGHVIDVVGSSWTETGIENREDDLTEKPSDYSDCYQQRYETPITAFMAETCNTSIKNNVSHERSNYSGQSRFSKFKYKCWYCRQNGNGEGSIFRRRNNTRGINRRRFNFNFMKARTVSHNWIKRRPFYKTFNQKSVWKEIGSQTPAACLRDRSINCYILNTKSRVSAYVVKKASPVISAAISLGDPQSLVSSNETLDSNMNNATEIILSDETSKNMESLQLSTKSHSDEIERNISSDNEDNLVRSTHEDFEDITTENFLTLSNQEITTSSNENLKMNGSPTAYSKNTSIDLAITNIPLFIEKPLVIHNSMEQTNSSLINSTPLAPDIVLPLCHDISCNKVFCKPSMSNEPIKAENPQLTVEKHEIEPYDSTLEKANEANFLIIPDCRNKSITVIPEIADKSTNMFVEANDMELRPSKFSFSSSFKSIADVETSVTTLNETNMHVITNTKNINVPSHFKLNKRSLFSSTLQVLSNEEIKNRKVKRKDKKTRCKPKKEKVGFKMDDSEKNQDIKTRNSKPILNESFITSDKDINAVPILVDKITYIESRDLLVTTTREQSSKIVPTEDMGNKSMNDSDKNITLSIDLKLCHRKDNKNVHKLKNIRNSTVNYQHQSSNTPLSRKQHFSYANSLITSNQDQVHSSRINPINTLKYNDDKLKQSEETPKSNLLSDYNNRHNEINPLNDDKESLCLKDIYTFASTHRLKANKKRRNRRDMTEPNATATLFSYPIPDSKYVDKQNQSTSAMVDNSTSGMFNATFESAIQTNEEPRKKETLIEIQKDKQIHVSVLGEPKIVVVGVNLAAAPDHRKKRSKMTACKATEQSVTSFHQSERSDESSRKSFEDSRNREENILKAFVEPTPGESIQIPTKLQNENLKTYSNDECYLPLLISADRISTSPDYRLSSFMDESSFQHKFTQMLSFPNTGFAASISNREGQKVSEKIPKSVIKADPLLLCQTHKKLIVLHSINFTMNPFTSTNKPKQISDDLTNNKAEPMTESINKNVRYHTKRKSNRIDLKRFDKKIKFDKLLAAKVEPDKMFIPSKLGTDPIVARLKATNRIRKNKMASRRVMLRSTKLRSDRKKLAQLFGKRRSVVEVVAAAVPPAAGAPTAVDEEEWEFEEEEEEEWPHPPWLPHPEPIFKTNVEFLNSFFTTHKAELIRFALNKSFIDLRTQMKRIHLYQHNLKELSIMMSEGVTELEVLKEPESIIPSAVMGFGQPAVPPPPTGHRGCIQRQRALETNLDAVTTLFTCDRADTCSCNSHSNLIGKRLILNLDSMNTMFTSCKPNLKACVCGPPPDNRYKQWPIYSLTEIKTYRGFGDKFGLKEAAESLSSEDEESDTESSDSSCDLCSEPSEHKITNKVDDSVPNKEQKIKKRVTYCLPDEDESINNENETQNTTTTTRYQHKIIKSFHNVKKKSKEQNIWDIPNLKLNPFPIIEVETMFMKSLRSQLTKKNFQETERERECYCRQKSKSVQFNTAECTPRIFSDIKTTTTAALTSRWCLPIPHACPVGNPYCTYLYGEPRCVVHEPNCDVTIQRIHMESVSTDNSPVVQDSSCQCRLLVPRKKQPIKQLVDKTTYCEQRRRRVAKLRTSDDLLNQVLPGSYDAVAVTKKSVGKPVVSNASTSTDKGTSKPKPQPDVVKISANMSSRGTQQKCHQSHTNRSNIKRAETSKCCQTVELCPTYSSVDLAQDEDRETLRSVYCLLSAIDGRVRRMNNTLHLRL